MSLPGQAAGQSGSPPAEPPAFPGPGEHGQPASQSAAAPGAAAQADMGKAPAAEAASSTATQPPGQPVATPASRFAGEACPPGIAKPAPPPAASRLPAKKAEKAAKPGAGSDTKASGAAGGDKKKKFRGTPPCLAWVDPEVPPKAVLLCVHGLGLYNGTYEPFGKRMSKLGVATYAIDMRGFGSWMEAKGREKVDFQACLDDVKAVLRVIHKAHPGLPVFLLGESMGGAIALQATALYPEQIDGLISSVPAGDRFQQKRTALKVALRLLAGPNKPFDVGHQVIRQATEKQALREAWGSDPLARLNISPKELIQFQDFMNRNHTHAKNIKTTPVLIVQGCQDKLVRPEGTVELYNELQTPDRQLVLVPGAEHLIFEENQFNDEVIDLVNGWITARLKRQPEASLVKSLN